jgi:hypothetical protein
VLVADPRAYSDTELRHITAPTLLMLGEHEVMYPSSYALIGRALRVFPNVEIARWVRQSTYQVRAAGVGRSARPAFSHGVGSADRCSATRLPSVTESAT